MDKKSKIKIIILLILFSALLVNTAFSYSKYISNSIWNYYLKSKEFYFTSNKLDDISSTNINTLWDGGSTFFSISNSASKTSITEYDINFELQCTVMGEESKKFDCFLNGTGQNLIKPALSSYQTCVNNSNDGVDVSTYNKTDCELKNYDWSHHKSEMEFYFDIIPKNTSDEATDIKVNIEARSTNPYKKTLKGDFSLHKIKKTSNNISIDYKNNDLFSNVVLTNSNTIDKCVNLNWDTNKYKIFTENGILEKIVDKNGYINQIKIKVESKNSKLFEFQKVDLTDINNVDNFTLTEVDC